MFWIFLLLSLASLIALIIGLINPGGYSRFVKGGLPRRKSLLIFGLGTIICFIISVATVPPVTNPKIENTNSPVQSPQPSVKQSFNDLSKKRFDDIKSAAPELKDIQGVDGDYTSVVYFDFKIIPEDLDFMIRSNTATFSVFKEQNTNTGHVTIFASYQDGILMQCDGAYGKVTQCK